MLIAIANTIGSSVASGLLVYVLFRFSAWELKRKERLRTEEFASKLGVSPYQVESNEIRPKLMELRSQRYSNELFVNRLSDLVASLIVGWVWAFILISSGSSVYLFWTTDFETRAAVGWFGLPVILIFFIPILISYYTCHLLTGRYPSEAKEQRKIVMDWLNQQVKK
jgi:hypothetical protein